MVMVAMDLTNLLFFQLPLEGLCCPSAYNHTLVLFIPAPELAPNVQPPAYIKAFPKQLRKVISRLFQNPHRTRQKEFEFHRSFISYANDTFYSFHGDLGNSPTTLKLCVVGNAVLILHFLMIASRISEGGQKNCRYIFSSYLYKLYPSKKNKVSFSPKVVPHSPRSTFSNH